MIQDTGALLQKFNDDAAIRGLTWTNDGKQLLASGKNKLLLLNPLTLVVERSITNLGVGQIIYSAMTPDGRYILAPCPFDQKLLLIETVKGKAVSTLNVGEAPISVQIAPDGQTAYVSNATDDHITAIDLRTLETQPFGKVSMPNGVGFRGLKNPLGR